MDSKQMNVDLSNATDLRCPKCEHRVFTPGVILKHLSALLSPTGKDTFVPVQVFQCSKCQTVPDEFLSAFGD